MRYPRLYELAMGFYVKYRETRPAEEYDPVLRAEAERKERERRRDLVTVSLKSVVQKQARAIGPEAVYRSTVELLRRKFSAKTTCKQSFLVVLTPIRYKFADF